MIASGGRTRASVATTRPGWTPGPSHGSASTTEASFVGLPVGRVRGRPLVQGRRVEGGPGQDALRDAQEGRRVRGHGRCPACAADAAPLRLQVDVGPSSSTGPGYGSRRS